MRIEETNKVRLAKAYDKELLILKLRFTQLWDKNFKDTNAAVVGSLSRNDFLKRYRLLLSEMNSRKLEKSTSAIDKAAFKKAMAMSKFGIDVTDFEDVVIMPDCIAVDAASIDIEKIDNLVEERRQYISEMLKREEERENAYIPLYDLVLRAKQATMKIEVQKPYPNEHSARLQSSDMAHIRVRRTKGGKVQGVTVPASIGVIWYVAVKAGKEVPIPQALRFPTKTWTAAKARKWLSDNDITSTKFEPAKAVKKMWSAKYIAKLPDSAFLHIVPSSEKGGMQISRRYFPYKASDGEVDLFHLKKAIAGMSQSELSGSIKIELQAKAEGILEETKEGKVFEKFVEVYPIDKADKDEHIVCGIVYEPDVVDAQGDKANEVEIRKAAYGFMEKVQTFRVNHEGKKVKVRVLESYVAPVDFTVSNKPIKKGTWMLTVRVLDKKIWEAVKDGELTGFSMAGYAKAS